ncbi:MAG: hypothetical protein ACRDYW_10225 [Acidimicrobiales bacterium]
MSNPLVATLKTCPACAEEIKGEALVCRFCGQEFSVRRVGYCSTCHRQVEVGDDARCPACHSEVVDVTIASQPLTPSSPGAPDLSPSPTPAPGAAPVAAPAEPAKRKPSFALRLVLALVVVVLAFVAVLVARSMMVGEASSPSDLADRFPEAGVVCQDFDIIFDDRETKALGCQAEAAQIITITTYADRPSLDGWRDLRCDSSTPVTTQGAYVFGDDFVIDIMQGPYPADLVTPTPIDQVAQNLAAVLGGTTGAYDCAAGT